MMTIGAALFDEVRDRWAAQIGASELDALQAHLAQLTEHRPLSAGDLARSSAVRGEAIMGTGGRTDRRSSTDTL
jgi:hypothetical protein